MNELAEIVELRSLRVDVLEAGSSPRSERVGCVIGEQIAFDTAGLEIFCIDELACRRVRCAGCRCCRRVL